MPNIQMINVGCDLCPVSGQSIPINLTQLQPIINSVGTSVRCSNCGTVWTAVAVEFSGMVGWDSEGESRQAVYIETTLQVSDISKARINSIEPAVAVQDTD